MISDALGPSVAVVNVPDHLYLEWRSQGAVAQTLQESRPPAPPPERWMQEIWAHQRLLRDRLQTSEGLKVVVLHPGFWNREAGPDFLRAVVQIGDDDPVSGDIEIDREPGGWKSHGHGQNAAYANVILHVVWDAAPAAYPLPTLAIRERLDAPVEELDAWVGGAGDVPSEWLRGHCAAPLARLSVPSLEAVLRQAALARLRTKGYLFRARARLAGWHQALWEGVFRGLGYKHNAWPMQRLAELLPQIRATPVETRDPREGFEARLLGLSGLLPPEPRQGSRPRRLWDVWWREQQSFRGQILPAGLWRLNGVRPANHPQRRLALASAWIADADWVARVERWFHEGTNGSAAATEAALLVALRPEADGFWRRHYTLSARALPEALPLLGAGRVTDLAVNAVLPWLWARAEAGGEGSVREKIETLYLGWSPGEDNATLKLARARLLGTEEWPFRKTAAVQQGLLQIVRDFCSYSNALCEQCRFPQLIGALDGPFHPVQVPSP